MEKYPAKKTKTKQNSDTETNQNKLTGSEIIELMNPPTSVSNLLDIPVKEESASWHDILGGDLPNGIDYDFNNLPKVNWSQYSKEDIAKFVDHLENLDFEDGVDVSGSGYDGMYRKAIKWVEKNLMGKK